MANIIVPVLHSVTYDIVFGGCIHYSMVSVVVESRSYAVGIVATEIPCLECVGISVYEYTEAGRANWGGIVVKRYIELFPG